LKTGGSTVNRVATAANSLSTGGEVEEIRDSRSHADRHFPAAAQSRRAAEQRGGRTDKPDLLSAHSGSLVSAAQVLAEVSKEDSLELL
jgi:hypothetical protein